MNKLFEKTVMVAETDIREIYEMNMLQPMWINIDKIYAVKLKTHVFYKERNYSDDTIKCDCFEGVDVLLHDGKWYFLEGGFDFEKV